MTLHECRGGQLFSELMQTLHGAVGFFASGSDEGVAFFGFQVKNGVCLDQVNRSVGKLNRKFEHDILLNILV
jgi:hypothetical protein